MTIDWTNLSWWLARSTLGASILLVIGLLLMRRAGQPARRQRIGEISLLAAIAVALAALAPAWLNLPLLTSEPRAATSVAREQGDIEPPLFVENDPLGARHGADVALPLVAAPQDDPRPEKEVPVPAVALPVPEENTDASSLALLLPYLLGLYFAGVALFLLRFVLGHVALWRLLRTCRPAPQDVQNLFDHCLHLVGPGRKARLLVSPRLRAPISFGVLRPTVVLPTKLCESDQAHRLGWVFAHELTHLSRRDALSATLLALGQAAFFYLPWFWWLRRQVRLCQEYVADAAAIKDAPADQYAEFLLTWAAAPAVPLGAAGVSGNTSDLFRRISMLLSHQNVERRCPRWWTALTALSLFGLALFLGGVGLSAAEADNIIIIIPSGKSEAKPAPKAGDKFTIRVAPDPDKKDVIFFRPAVVAPLAIPPTPAVPVPPPLSGGKVVIKEIDGKDFLLFRAGEAAGKEIRLHGEPGKPLIVVTPDGKVISPPTGAAKWIGKDGIFEIELAFPPEAQAGARFWRADTIDRERLRKLLDRIEAAPGKLDIGDVQKELAEILGKAPAARLTIAPEAMPQRLGLKLGKVPDVLAEHLNLKKGHGLIINEVASGSIADKAGLKPKDLIIKIQDTAVTDDPAFIGKALEKLKAGSEFDVTVVRKGKEEKVRLQAPAAGTGAPTTTAPATGLYRYGLPTTSTVPMLPRVPAAGTVLTTTFRTGDNRFTTRHQEGSLVITVTGKVAGDKAQVEEISIQDGGTSHKFDSADKVPAAYRDRVNHMISISGGVRIESRP